ncbi:secreted protein [gut metagenome]|uniref:Secreted protein n=1 Tax=gut metagenome TaxID=749906 RepID=J9FZV6_9ZZZZ
MLNPYGAWMIGACILLVLLIAFGSTLVHKLAGFNRKHHVVGWDESTIYAWDEDED